jgi:hypothetical protein
VGNLAFLLFNKGARALSLSGTVSTAGPLCTLGDWPPDSCRVADCHSVGELGFHLLDKGDWTLLLAIRSEKCWASVHFEEAGLLVLFTELQAAAFLPSVGNLAFLLFDGGRGTLQLSGTVGLSGLLCALGDGLSGATH